MYPDNRQTKEVASRIPDNLHKTQIQINKRHQSEISEMERQAMQTKMQKNTRMK